MYPYLKTCYWGLGSLAKLYPAQTYVPENPHSSSHPGARILGAVYCCCDAVPMSDPSSVPADDRLLRATMGDTLSRKRSRRQQRIPHELKVVVMSQHGWKICFCQCTQLQNFRFNNSFVYVNLFRKPIKSIIWPKKHVTEMKEVLKGQSTSNYLAVVDGWILLG